MWPESVVRDETMSVLGITDIAPPLETTLPLDDAAALEAALVWLERRTRLLRRGETF